MWDTCIMYVTPFVLAWLMLNDLSTEFTQQPSGGFYGGYDGVAVLLIGPAWLVAVLIAAFVVTLFPWKRQLADNAHEQT